MLAVTFAASAPVSAPAQQSVQQSPQQSAQLNMLPDDPATVIAVVGQSPILWGDIEPKIDARINQVLKEKNLSYSKEELAPARLNLARGLIAQTIQTKMMSECFLIDQVGTESAEKRQEVSAMMATRARQMFFEDQLKGLKKQYGTEDLNELDEKLREQGSSLRARQREFTDMIFGQMYMRSKIDKDPKVTIAEITTAYEKDIDNYRHGAKARWEQLSILFENHPDPQEGRRKLIEMARTVYYNKGWKRMAKENSEEPFAVDGGQHDWTTQGALASKPLDEQIFSLPLDRMSEVIEDDVGLHIIRVIERKPAGTTPLADVQDRIREKLKKEKVAAAQSKMLEQMRAKVPVWSIFADDFPDAKPLRPTQVASLPGGNDF